MAYIPGNSCRIFEYKVGKRCRLVLKTGAIGSPCAQLSNAPSHVTSKSVLLPKCPDVRHCPLQLQKWAAGRLHVGRVSYQLMICNGPLHTVVCSQQVWEGLCLFWGLNVPVLLACIHWWPQNMPCWRHLSPLIQKEGLRRTHAQRNAAKPRQMSENILNIC